MDCLSQGDKDNRMQLLASAVSILKANPNTRVYLDAGHSNWVSPDTIAARLQKSNVAKADGFFTNVSNFMTTDAEATYGAQVSAKLEGKHFVIDTSRNANGPTGYNQSCTPAGRAVGAKSTPNPGNRRADAHPQPKTPRRSRGHG